MAAQSFHQSSDEMRCDCGRLMAGAGRVIMRLTIRRLLVVALLTVATVASPTRADDLADKIEQMERQLQEMKRELQAQKEVQQKAAAEQQGKILESACRLHEEMRRHSNILCAERIVCCKP